MWGMTDRAFFHLAFLVVFVAFIAVRAFYHRRAVRTRGRVEFREGRLFVRLRIVFGVPFVILLVAYAVRPGLLAWAELPLPVWARWVGVVMGLASVASIWWVQWALGSNFSGTLHVRDEHTLVTHGPYRWVRHPMYAVFYLHLFAILLLTANWFLGGASLLALTLVVAARLRKEEAVMVEKFGDEYRAYMERTGRFLPRIKARPGLERELPDGAG